MIPLITVSYILASIICSAGIGILDLMMNSEALHSQISEYIKLASQRDNWILSLRIFERIIDGCSIFFLTFSLFQFCRLTSDLKESHPQLYISKLQIFLHMIVLALTMTFYFGSPLALVVLGTFLQFIICGICLVMSSHS